MCFPSGSAVKHLPAMQETQEPWIRPLSRDDPLEEGTATTPVLSPGESHGLESMGLQSQMRLSACTCETAERAVLASSFPSREAFKQTLNAQVSGLKKKG